MNVAFMAFNVLRASGRERLGLSVGISGNGFGLSRATLEAVPIQYTFAGRGSRLSPPAGRGRTKDRLRRVHPCAWRDAGRRTGRLDSDVRDGRAGGCGRRSRICRDCRRDCSGKPRLIEPTLELLLMPLAFHVSLLVADRVDALHVRARLRPFRAGVGRPPRRGRNTRGRRRSGRFRSAAECALLCCLEARCFAENLAVGSQCGALDSDRTLTSSLLAYVRFIHSTRFRVRFRIQITARPPNLHHVTGSEQIGTRSSAAQSC